MTFGRDGEERLSTWMADNAFVCWVEHPRPWQIESVLIRELRPPLNLADNAEHPFCSTLRGLRGAAKQTARLAIVDGCGDVIV